MLKMDMLPKDLEHRRKVRFRNISIIVLVLLIVLVGSAYWAFFYYGGNLDSELQNVKQESARIDKEIEQYEADLEQALIAQKRLGNLDRLLNERLYWTNLFGELGRVTIPDVFYTGFSSDLDTREMTLPAKARDYQSLARQLKAWEGEGMLESIEVSSASLETDEGQTFVSFTSNLFFKKEAWQD